MKKFLLYIIMLFCHFMANAQVWPPANMSGDGSANRPWQIETPEHLAALAQYVNSGHGMATKGKHYRVMNDIDLTTFLADSTAGWLPIGTNGNNFGGMLHGAGHVISGLRINRPALGDCGLFGNLEAAIIDSLGVEVAENDSVRGQDATGILAGRAGNFSKISQCYVKGNVIGGANVGGLVGRFNNSYIENCYAIVNVKGVNPVWTFAGGLVGFNYNSVDTITGISYSYATGNVEGKGDYAGGLVGYGRNVQEVSKDNVKNCVAANSEVNGKLVGKIGYSYAENCYSLDGMVQSDNEGIDGIASNAHELHNQDFYTNAANWQDTAWNFDEVWMMHTANSLPVLRWQHSVDTDDFVITVNGKPVQGDQDTFMLDIDCGDNALEIAIDARQAKVIINGTVQDSYVWNLSDYGDNSLQLALVWPGEDTATYTLSANKPLPFEQVVSVHWNNTLTVINNPANNGGYTFTSFNWYRNSELISTNQWWSAGHHGEQLNPDDIYNVELTAVGIPGTLRSCENSVALKMTNFSAHPNPVSEGQTLYLETDVDADQLKDAVIEVYNNNAQLVETLRALSQTPLDVKYSKGVYVFILKGKNGLRKELKIIVL